MKKFCFTVFIILLICVGLNFILRQIHIKAIETLISDSQKTMAEIDITLDYATIDHYGNFFWEIESKLNNSEIYTTISDCILYFKIPIITLKSQIKTNNTVIADITLPSEIKGILDMNESVANEYKMAKQYRLSLTTKDEIKIDSIIHGIRKTTNKEIYTKIPVLKLGFVEENQSDMEKIFDTSEITVKSNFDMKNKLHLLADVEDLNIYIGLEMLAQYLTRSISVHDASKNINLSLDFTRISEVLQDKSLQKTYSGHFNTLSRAFDVKISGSDINIKAKTGERKDISDLDFSIREFDIFMDYCTGIVMSMKRKAKQDYDISKVQETSDLFKDAVIKNSKPEKDRMINFRIKDKDSVTFFNDKPIEDVFDKFIKKAKELD